MKILVISAFVACVFLLNTSYSYSQTTSNEPVQAREILFGMSTALSGPAADLGLNMLLGVNTRFAEENDKGGIQGWKLRMIVRDDAYEPHQTAPNMRELIEKENVLAVIGNVGTPTAIAAIPIANELKTLLFAAYSGAGVLRKDPPDRYVINYRASYAEETSAMVDALINYAGIKPEEVAFFSQRDGYGDAGFNGGIMALLDHDLKSESKIIHVRYERNTMAVENAVADILLASPPPRAIIMIGAYAPSAKFIKLARQNGVDALFLNVSFVGSVSLARELGDVGNDVIVTQVVPHPMDNSLPLIRKYKAALKKFAASTPPSFGSLEGYIAASILIKALKTLKQPTNRESIITALEKLGDFDIGMGQVFYFGDGNRQASHRVWPTILQNGQFKSFVWKDIVSFLSP